MNGYKFIAVNGLDAAIKHLDSLEIDVTWNYPENPELIREKISALKQAITDHQLIEQFGGIKTAKQAASNTLTIFNTQPLLQAIERIDKNTLKDAKDLVTDHGLFEAKRVLATEQVHMVGNSVSPEPIAAIARANNPFVNDGGCPE